METLVGLQQQHDLLKKMLQQQEEVNIQCRTSSTVITVGISVVIHSPVFCTDFQEEGVATHGAFMRARSDCREISLGGTYLCYMRQNGATSRRFPALFEIAVACSQLSQPSRALVREQNVFCRGKWSLLQGVDNFHPPSCVWLHIHMLERVAKHFNTSLKHHLNVKVA